MFKIMSETHECVIVATHSRDSVFKMLTQAKGSSSHCPFR